MHNDSAFATVNRRVIPLEQIELSEDERLALMGAHQPIFNEWRDVYDEAAQQVVGKSIPLPAAICVECRQPWGEFGCTAYRAAFLIRLYAERKVDDARRVTELEFALSDRFRYLQRVPPGQDVLEVAMRIDRGSLLLGGIKLVHAQLVQIEKHWRKWFKDVGDQQRIRENPIHELAMDNDRVMFLREFRAGADFEKPAGEPWQTK